MMTIAQTHTLRQRAALFFARYGIVIVLFALLIVFSLLSPVVRDGRQLFMTVPNIIQILQQASINATIAIGMTFVITSGGIDLSVGSIVALAGVLAAMLMKGIPITPDFTLQVGWLGGVLVILAVGTLCGLFNAFLITRLNLVPFIATLGTMGIFRGIALVLSDGRSVYGFDMTFVNIFTYRLPLGGGIEIPFAVIVMIVVALLFGFILTQTKLGKYTVAIGGNEDTARAAGIAVKRYKVMIYAIGGLLTGIAGALLLARLRSGDPTFGRFFELDAIAAVVMGGTSLSGGTGTIVGTIVGALIISVVQNAMNIFNVPSYWQEVVIGSVIVAAVLLDQWRKRQTQS